MRRADGLCVAVVGTTPARGEAPLSPQTQTAHTIRPFTEDDYPAYVAVSNATFPEYPTTVEALRFGDRNRDSKCRHARFVAETGGVLVGIGSYDQWSGMYHPHKFALDVMIRPEWQGQGLGASLYTRVMAALDPLEPLSVRCQGRADLVRGIADGAGQPVDRIAALNVRYGILYSQFGQNATTVRVPDGCTAFAVAPEASLDGHLLVGENWDWIPEVRGALLHTTEADGFATLAFTEAGIFGGKIGLNSAGLGLVINGMTTTTDDWSRLSSPFHARCRAILRARDLDAATAVITAAPRACAANFLLAQAPDRIVDIEAAPDRAPGPPRRAASATRTTSSRRTPSASWSRRSSADPTRRIASTECAGSSMCRVRSPSPIWRRRCAIPTARPTRSAATPT